MTRARIPPYRTVKAIHAPAVQWYRVHGEAESAIDVSDWDPATDLKVRATLEFDGRQVAEDCGFEGDETLRLFLGWDSNGTRLRGGTLSELSVDLGSGRGVVEVVIPGAEVGGRLTLEVAIILAEARQSTPFVASRPGSVIWSDQVKIDLAGSGTRFPTEFADFSTIPGISPEAAWFLDWDAMSPQMPVLGGVRLMINTNVPRVVDAVRSGAASGEALAIREAVRFDVVRAMVTGALVQWKAGDLDDLPEDSVGDAVLRILRSLPGRPNFESLQATFLSRPSEVEAALMGYFRTFGDQGEDPS